MLLAFDLLLCALVALLAYSLRVGEWRIFRPVTASLVGVTLTSWLLIAPAQGVYRSLLRFFGGRAIRDLAVSCGALSIPLFLCLVLFPINARIPRTLSVLIPLILFIFLASTRALLASLLRETLYSSSLAKRRRVLVYGAGVAGRELALSMGGHSEFHIVGFVDDNPVLAGRRLEGQPIWHSSELTTLLEAQFVDEVLLAIPTASRARRRTIVGLVRDLAPGVGVRSLPNLAEIVAGRISVADLREVQIEELLGRDQVAPDPHLMSAVVTGRTVMVTGAGGSIGSELSRQILMQAPKRIVLAERSELALYMIEHELRELRDRYQLTLPIEPRLVDVCDRDDLGRVFREFTPEAVFHAAAYKHVPLLESDPIAGLRNNIVGTYTACLLAEEFKVQNFILVSTDKAVRPTSVMGASKRICELIILARSAAQEATKFSAVRFGNVLGSSGSVVPLFRAQIAKGGPVTVTHKDATRYFMTIPEAAQLVVQAGAMAGGGEIFLLEMGEPVRIYDLAKMMIQLSGLAAAGEDGRDGDIEIVEVGLRPGEKMHEELLIENQGLPTSHARIMKASESASIPDAFDEMFPTLVKSLDEHDAARALEIVETLASADFSGRAVSGDVDFTSVEVPNSARRRKPRVSSTRAAARL